jgi:ribulose-5-phosphate 4-epimerase/fuculose-1-phosphate aldolase
MSIKEKNEEYKRFAKWANKIGQSGLLLCSSGNLSHRVDEETLIVSESRKWLANLKQNHIVKVGLQDGNVIEGNHPTGELPLHLEVFRQNPNVNTVLHCQSGAATALACRQSAEINYNVIIEVPIYIGNVVHLPFIMPGTKELANEVAKASMHASVIQLSNHGQIIIGTSYKDVYQKAHFFELACQIIISNNFNCQPITAEQFEQLKGYR